MNQFKNQLLNLTILRKSKLFFFLVTLFSSIIIYSEPAHATKEETKCKDLTLPSIISDGVSDLNPTEQGCTITPSVFKVTAHELGICTEGNNPFSSSGLDTSGCFTLWSSDDGEEYNLVDENLQPAIFTLDESTVNEPPLGTYKYAYIIIDDTIKLKAEVALAGETWKTSAEANHLEYRTSATDEGPQASIGKVSTSAADEVPTRVGYFAPNGCYIEELAVKGTTVSGIFLKSNKTDIAEVAFSRNNFDADDSDPSTNVNRVYCSGAKYIGGVQTLSTPITITENTTSGTLSFDTTDTGAWVEAYQYSSVTTDQGPGGSSRLYFDIGPFIVRFTVN